jgi:hypothetical protein
MVTTFSPPGRPKKKQLPVVPIALGTVAGLLLVGVVFLISELSKQKAQSAFVSDVVMKTAVALGTDTNAVAALVDPVAAAATNALSLPAIAAEQVAALAAARADAETAKAETAKVKTDGDATAQQMTAMGVQLDKVRGDLETRTGELADLKKIYDNDTTRLYATIEALNKKLDDAKKLGASADETAVAESEDVVVSEEVVTEAASASTPGDSDAVEKAKTQTAGDSQAIVIPSGKSILFKSARYDGDNKKLTFLTLDDRSLVYSDVPREIYDGLAVAPLHDIYYRFKIMDVFESKPKDRELLRTIKP